MGFYNRVVMILPNHWWLSIVACFQMFGYGEMVVRNGSYDDLVSDNSLFLLMNLQS